MDKLKGGLRFRTVPEGYEHLIDWHDPNVRRKLNVEASEVTIRAPSSRGWLIVGIEVLPPGALEVPPSSADAPAASPAPPRTVSDKDLRDCILAIVEDHPNDPLEVDSELWPEVERRLGQSVARDRVRAVREKVAPQWVNPVGRPRKPAQ